jgi:hypothetical protein
VFDEIRQGAELLADEKLSALAFTNLFQVSVMLGEPKRL